MATVGTGCRCPHRYTSRQKETKSSSIMVERAIESLHRCYCSPSLLHLRVSEGKPPNNCGRDGKEVSGCCGHLPVSLSCWRYFLNCTVEHSESCVIRKISTNESSGIYCVRNEASHAKHQVERCTVICVSESLSSLISSTFLERAFFLD